MKAPSLKKTIWFLVVAFLVYSVWTNPTGSGDAASHFLGHVGDFVSTLIDKVASFLKGL